MQIETNISWLEDRTAPLLTIAKRNQQLRKVEKKDDFINFLLKALDETPDYYRNATLYLERLLDKETSLKETGYYISKFSSGKRVYRVYDEDVLVGEYNSKDEAVMHFPTEKGYKIQEYDPEEYYEVLDKNEKRAIKMLFPTETRAIIFMLDMVGGTPWHTAMDKMALTTDEDEEESFHEDEFKNLLKRAIGDTPQKTFAARIGISAAYLSRQLNGKGISRPSAATLINIAKNSSVDIKDLFRCCGYSEEAAPVIEKNKEKDSDAGWIHKNLTSLLTFTSENKQIKLMDIQDIYNLLYSEGEEDATFNIKEPITILSSKFKNEEARIVDVKWCRKIGDHETSVLTSHIALLGHRSKNDEWYTENIIVRPEDIAEVSSEMKAFYKSEGDRLNLDILNEPVYYNMYKDAAFLENATNKLFRKIYEEMYAEPKTKIDTISGYGMEMEDEEIDFVAFLTKHRKTFEASSDEREFCRQVIEQKIAPDELCSYIAGLDNIDGEGSIGTVISQIIERETGVNLEYWRADPDSSDTIVFDNKSCFIYRDSETCEDSESKKVIDTLITYGKELGIKEVKYCFYTMRVSPEIHFDPIAL